MNKTNEARPHHTRPRFYDICIRCQLDYGTLQAIANQANVPLVVLDAMFKGEPVGRDDAEKVLRIVSQQTRLTWTLGDLDILTVPTLADLFISPGFDADHISQQAGVPFAILDQMLADQPVSKEDAIKVLSALSAQTGQDYTLSTVAVKLLNEEGDPA